MRQGRAYVGNFGFDLDRGAGTPAASRACWPSTRPPCSPASIPMAACTSQTDMHFPNGSVITPDGRTLIVAETLALRLTAFDIAADGTLSNRRVWAPVGMRAPDGICLDADGHVWIANAIAPECVLFAPGRRGRRDRRDGPALLRLRARRR